MRKIISIGAFCIFILILKSGLFEQIIRFFAWLFMLSMTESDISIGGQIFVRAATFVISYFLVGIIAEALGWFNPDAMSLAYFVISTIISFGLCYVIMLIETHLLQIAIALGVILAIVVVVRVVMFVRRKKKEKAHELF